MPSNSMATIQKLYEVCKVSLSGNGPLSPEAVDSVCSVLDMVMPCDVGLETEAQSVRSWRSPRALNRKSAFHSSSAIRYRHIHECKSFSIGIFCIPASSIIPLHNHPGMTVFSKLLYGSMHVKSYDWVDTPQPLNLSKARPAKIARDGEMSAPCGAMVTHPTDGGNIHAIKAITPCAILDILSPPYSSEDGRHCSYFRRCRKADPSGILLDRSKGSELVWLEEHQPPNSFVIRRDLYTGPALSL
ncbi:plant cysteine oxidase 5-like [Oryza brachyantha]|uniref:cysteine dioxygenase n=1 Tax=Oryza brachyantha TaxID=4533 RepID=J3MWH3_ORYBR|nr:plant cysteine oxidase 5-like [Oryza brachyantha]